MQGYAAQGQANTSDLGMQRLGEQNTLTQQAIANGQWDPNANGGAGGPTTPKGKGGGQGNYSSLSQKQQNLLNNILPAGVTRNAFLKAHPDWVAKHPM